MAWLLDWLLKPVVGTVVQWVFRLGGATMLAFLKKKGSPWFVPAAWGLVGFALVSIGYAFFRIPTTISANTSALSAIARSLSGVSKRLPPPPVTPDTIEARIRGWLDPFGWSIRNIPAAQSPDSFFAFEATSSSGARIVVARPRSVPRYIVLSSSFTFTDEPESSQLKQMTGGQLRRLTQELRVELSRSAMDYSIDLRANRFTVVRNIPITGDLTEDVFMRRMGEVEAGTILAANTVALELPRFSVGNPRP